MTFIDPRAFTIQKKETCRHSDIRKPKESIMKRFIIFVVTVLAAAFLLSPEAKAQGTPLLCKVSLGGSGFASVTLSNLTTKTIPKGQTLFAKKGMTIKFEAAEDIRENGSVSYRTNDAAFQDDGDCSGWY
jgi:hypothetical protein